MVSLLYKDMINLKQQLRIYFLMIVLWVAVGLKSSNIGFLGGVLSMFSLLLPITAYSYDERAGWDKYALSMPYSRRQLVYSKYALSLIGLVFSVVFTGAVGFFMGNDRTDLIMQLLAFWTMGLLGADVILPLVFRFGVEKARMIMLIVILVPTFLVLLLEDYISAAGEAVLEYGIYAAVAAAVVLLPLSAVVSLRIYSKKEF